MKVKGKVLLVDDEASDRAVIVNALRGLFAAVLEAQNFSEAMGIFDRYLESVQLLIADISLPDGNGCDLALKMHRQKPGLRVLFVSGEVGSQLCRYYGLDLNDLHFLRKPFTRIQLLERIEAVLKTRQSFPALAVPKTLTA